MLAPAISAVRSPAGPMISVIGLHKSFGEKEVLRGIDLEIGRGESLMLVGGSGAGKSVFIKHLIGLLQTRRGPRGGRRRRSHPRLTGGRTRAAKKIRDDLSRGRTLRLDDRRRQPGSVGCPPTRDANGKLELPSTAIDTVADLPRSLSRANNHRGTEDSLPPAEKPQITQIDADGVDGFGRIAACVNCPENFSDS